MEKNTMYIFRNGNFLLLFIMGHDIHQQKGRLRISLLHCTHCLAENVPGTDNQSGFILHSLLYDLPIAFRRIRICMVIRKGSPRPQSIHPHTVIYRFIVTAVLHGTVRQKGDLTARLPIIPIRILKHFLH